MKRLKEVEKKEQEFLEGSRDKVMFEELGNKVADTPTDTDMSINTYTDTDTLVYTFMDTSTDTLLDMAIEKREKIIKCTAYLPESQANFIKQTAKDRGVKESEIFRIAVKLLMEGGKIKG